MGPKEQQETPAQKALADHAVNLLQDYKQRWLPVQQRLAQTIEQSGEKDSAARRLAAGKSSTDVATQFDKAEGGLEKSLSNSGVGPGSSRANLGVTGMGTDAAAATGMGHVMSDQAIDSAYTESLGALTMLGRGERAQVGQSMSAQAADSAAQSAADAQTSEMSREGNAGLIGQVGGFGLQQSLKAPNPGVAGDQGGVAYQGLKSFGTGIGNAFGRP